MNTMKYSNTDDTNGLLLNDLANGYTVYAFDLTVEAQLNVAFHLDIYASN